MFKCNYCGHKNNFPEVPIIDHELKVSCSKCNQSIFIKILSLEENNSAKNTSTERDALSVKYYNLAQEHTKLLKNSNNALEYMENKLRSILEMVEEIKW